VEHRPGKAVARGAACAGVAAGRRAKTSFRFPAQAPPYLEENCGALQVKLSAEDLRRIEEVAPKGAASASLSEAMMSLVKPLTYGVRRLAAAFKNPHKLSSEKSPANRRPAS